MENDLISRQAVIDYIERRSQGSWFEEHEVDILDFLNALPPAMTAEVIANYHKEHGEVVVTTDLWEDAEKALKSTPLSKGHWTERTMHDNGFFMPNCSECGAMQPYAQHVYRSNFCPNCGADMRGEQNESAD